LGEELARTVNHKGGRPKKNGDTASQLIPSELGKGERTRKQSSRAQKLARVPWRDQERMSAAWAVAFLREQRPVEAKVKAEAA
jgi:hypothetical protein